MEKNKDYQDLVRKHAPKSRVVKNSALAALFGGSICFVGEWLAYLYMRLGASDEHSYVLVSATYITLASLFTALGFFDKIARYSGAGTLLPVTGFANSVTSSAIDARSEGFVAGVGKGIFTVAGPVILYSAVSGTVYGIIYYLLGVFGIL